MTDGERVTFAAKPTNEAGVYLAKVKFPSAGSWKYEVYDGFTQYGGAQKHTFGAISVGGGSGAGSGSDFPVLPVTAGSCSHSRSAIWPLVLLACDALRPRPAPQL